MKTEELNSYAYTMMVIDLARRLRNSDHPNPDDPLTRFELSAAVQLLEQRRSEVISIFQELRPELY